MSSGEKKSKVVFPRNGANVEYVVGKTLGRGSYAAVKLAIESKTHKAYAVKVFDRLNQDFSPKLLEQEIETMKTLQHPNIVQFIDFYQDKKKAYLLLELVDGGTVLDRILANECFSEKDAACVTVDVVNALHFLHNMGVSHRDLKPQNLLYASSDPSSPDFNTVKVADFGLASFYGDQSVMSTVCGTAEYLAPEMLDQLQGGGFGYGPEVDLWSLGVCVYGMLCGFAPFFDESRPALFSKIKRGKVNYPSPYWEHVSEGAKDFISKVLVVDPVERYTAAQCLEHEWVRRAGEASARKLHSSHRAFLLIQKMPVFENIDLACLEEITTKLKMVKAPQGELVMRAGEIGDCMYFINAGFVQINVEGKQVDLLHVGDCFGEIALVMSTKRIADAKSLGSVGGLGPLKSEMRPADPVELFQLMRRDFEAVLERYPVLRSRLTKIGQARVENAARRSRSIPEDTLRALGVSTPGSPGRHAEEAEGDFDSSGAGSPPVAAEGRRESAGVRRASAGSPQARAQAPPGSPPRVPAPASSSASSLTGAGRKEGKECRGTTELAGGSIDNKSCVGACAIACVADGDKKMV